MPVKTAKRNGAFRVVESTTGRIAKNAAGTALDGGGFKTQSAADKQASAVNANTSRVHKSNRSTRFSSGVKRR